MNRKQQEEMAAHVDLFISVMICFPEVGKIRYDRERDLLSVFFLLNRCEEKKGFEEKQIGLEKAVAAFHRLHKTKRYFFSFNHRDVHGYRVVEIRRDLSTVSRMELAFLVDLCCQCFDEEVVTEAVNPYDDGDIRRYFDEERRQSFEDGQFQMDMEHVGNEILVYRDAGKVLVFSNG